MLGLVAARLVQIPNRSKMETEELRPGALSCMSAPTEEDEQVIDEMLTQLGIPTSDKKKRKKQSDVIELITPPRVSRAPRALADPIDLTFSPEEMAAALDQASCDDEVVILSPVRSNTAQRTLAIEPTEASNRDQDLIRVFVSPIRRQAKRSREEPRISAILSPVTARSNSISSNIPAPEAEPLILSASSTFAAPVVEPIVAPVSASVTASEPLVRPSARIGRSRTSVPRVIVQLERSLADSAAGQAIQIALHEHRYNNKPLPFELASPMEHAILNTLMWKREDVVSIAVYFEAVAFMELLQSRKYAEVLMIIQKLQQEQKDQRQNDKRSQLPSEDEESTSNVFMIIEGMDRALIQRKRKKQPQNNQNQVLCFQDLYEMAFQLYMDTGAHTKVLYCSVVLMLHAEHAQIIDSLLLFWQFTCDVEATASYVALVTREIVISSTKLSAQDEFLESVPRLHSFRVTATGATMNTFANTWLRMLQMIPGVSEDKAQSILNHYPSFASLMSAYEDPTLTRAMKEDLLADKMHGRKSERTLSKKIFTVFSAEDPQAIV